MLSSPQFPKSCPSITVRQCTLEDAKAVAQLWHSVFKPSIKHQTPFSARPNKTCEEWEIQLSSALSAKLQARYEGRIRRLEQEAEAIRTQLAVVTRQPLASASGGHGTGSYDEGRQKDKFARSFYCFVAVVHDQEAEEEGEQDGRTILLNGAVAMSLAQPQAVLPPPFPSAAPWRCYVSNMAVHSRYRRLGIGSALLARCERTARMLGHTSLWLHVDSDNKQAADFYRDKGYVEFPLKKIFLDRIKDKYVAHRCLLYKELGPWGKDTNDNSVGLKASRNNANGTFIWEI
jgi:ribosomal protein S18 acetylase RimI-like enzyme